MGWKSGLKGSGPGQAFRKAQRCEEGLVGPEISQVLRGVQGTSLGHPGESRGFRRTRLWAKASVPPPQVPPKTCLLCLSTGVPALPSQKSAPELLLQHLLLWSNVCGHLPVSKHGAGWVLWGWNRCWWVGLDTVGHGWVLWGWNGCYGAGLDAGGQVCML